MKRKIIKKGNVVMYLTDKGWFHVYDGQWIICSQDDFNIASKIFCETIDSKHSHICRTKSNTVKPSTTKCRDCFLGKITGGR